MEFVYSIWDAWRFIKGIFGHVHLHIPFFLIHPFILFLSINHHRDANWHVISFRRNRLRDRRRRLHSLLACENSLRERLHCQRNRSKPRYVLHCMLNTWTKFIFVMFVCLFKFNVGFISGNLCYVLILFLTNDYLRWSEEWPFEKVRRSQGETHSA